MRQQARSVGVMTAHCPCCPPISFDKGGRWFTCTHARNHPKVDREMRLAKSLINISLNRDL